MAEAAYDLSHGKTPRFVMTLFTREEVNSFWPEMEKTLDRVPDSWRRWTKDFIYQSIQEGRIQVWGVGSPSRATFVMFTTVHVFPAMRVIEVSWAVGHFEDGMASLIDATIANYAQLNNCDEIEVRGRMGWGKKVEDYGFKREAVMWTKRVPKSNLN